MDSSIQCEKVRVVARIRGYGDQAPAATAPSLSVRKLQSKSSGSERFLISISGEQSASSNKPLNYEVDHCYDHDVSNDLIFIEEIKPLISTVFEGNSATVFAYGARGSGKTYTIQGSENVAGLMTLSISEFLSRAEVGNYISVSLYEVVQDRVFDLLDSKKPEISVLEGAHGKVVLKGLSKVIVKSMSDFQKSCFAIIQSPLQKMPNELPQRGHRGMIINVLSSVENASLLGRMNLVDLAGYEDKRQSNVGPNHIEISRINKSLYATHNVLHALKNNETHVPYRESKLTRMLQGSLGGMNKILMITCMDPSFSEDTIKALSLASRSCYVGDKTKVDHSSRVRGLIKPTITPTSATKQPVVLSSKTKMDHSSRVRSLIKPAVTPTSSTKQTEALSSKMNIARSSVSASTRKQAKSLFHTTEKKPQDVKVQGRKLFEEQQSNNTKEDTLPEKNMEVTEPSRVQEGTLCADNVSDPALVISANQGENCVAGITEQSLAVSTNEVSSLVEEISARIPSIEQPVSGITTEQVNEDLVSKTPVAGITEQSLAVSTYEVSSLVEETSAHIPSIEQPVSGIPTEQVNEENLVSKTPVDHHQVTSDIDILQADKENKVSALNEDASPPLSVRLLELSNNLKSLYTFTPLNPKMELETYNSIKGSNQTRNDPLEPSTPMSQPTLNGNSKCQYSGLMSPWEQLHVRSTGMKESLVKECLNFLNSASKEELKGLKGIGEKRAGYILELRDDSPEPFKTLEDLKEIGLTSKQINGMMKTVAGALFD